MNPIAEMMKDLADKMICQRSDWIEVSLEDEYVPTESMIHQIIPSFHAVQVNILNFSRIPILACIDVQVRSHLLVSMSERMKIILDLSQFKCSPVQPNSNEVGLIHCRGKNRRTDIVIVFQSEMDAVSFVEVISMHHDLTSIETIKPLVTIGKGKFGLVAICRKDGKFCAVKESKLTSSLEKHIWSERLVLERTPPSRFLVNTSALVRRGLHFYNIMEFCPGGDLYTLISTYFVEIREHSNFYMAEILLGLQHLHQHEILYRDLKPENIMVCADGHIKLGDFGLSKYVGAEEAKTVCGTESYMSPEVLSGKGYSYSVDFWQYACLVFELHVGCSPFYQKQGSKAEKRKAVREARFEHDENTPGHAKRLVDSIIKIKINERRYWRRYDWNDMKKDGYFADFDWKACESGGAEPPIIPQERVPDALNNFDRSFRRISARFTDSSGLSHPSIDGRFAGFDFHQKSARKIFLETSAPSS